MLKKFFALWAGLLFMIGVAAGVYLMLDSLGGPMLKPVSGIINNVTGSGSEQVLVGPYTIVKKVNRYPACNDLELNARGQAEKELVGLDLNRLQMKYPAAEGWDVTFKGDEVTITRNIDGYCGLHRSYRHLGIHNGKLAVYQGPLGNDDTLLRLENNIEIELLPKDWRSRLHQTANYNELTPEEKKDLHETVEFPGEYELNMVLENFDEMDGEINSMNR